jgi:S1-C subfamily serine protease
MSAAIQLRCDCGNTVREEVSRLGLTTRCDACGEEILVWSRDLADTSADREWFVELQGKTRGPVTFVELRRLVSEGRVDRDTPVRRGSDGPWTRAADVRGSIDVQVPTRVLRSRRRRARSRSREPGPRLDPQLVRLAVAGSAALILLPLLLVLLRRERREEAAQPLTSAEIAERTLPSVAAVRGRWGSGSGFVVAPGVLATNYHVIERELIRDLVVEFPNASAGERPQTPSLRYVDPTADLAFLVVGPEADPLPLAEGEPFVPGKEILVVGSPGLGDGRTVFRNAVARGILSTITEIEGRSWYQLDVSVNPGNSGGPVVDERGRVMGVVTAKAAEGDRLSFALPVSELERCLRMLEAATADDARRVAALHRLKVAETTVLPAARIYLEAMTAYLHLLDPRYGTDGSQAGGADVLRRGVSAVLDEADRELLSDLRLEEPRIRKDRGLTPEEQRRFANLWATYAELKRAVDEPEGSVHEYAVLRESLGERLSRLAARIEASWR